jgi:hypothetical protein
MGLLPPLLYVTLQELAAAKLVDLCALECDSVPANLDFYSFFAFLLFTPALLILFLGTLEKHETGIRTAGLAILLLSFYGWFFVPGSGLFTSSNPFVQPLLLLLPVLLIMAMGYLVATARTPKVILIVLLAALLPSALLVAVGYPAPGMGTQYSCSETTIVNASSPFPVTTNVCTPYQVTLAGPGFPSEYVLWVTIFAVVAAIADIVFIHSYRSGRARPASPSPAAGGADDSSLEAEQCSTHAANLIKISYAATRSCSIQATLSGIRT